MLEFVNISIVFWRCSQGNFRTAAGQYRIGKFTFKKVGQDIFPVRGGWGIERQCVVFNLDIRNELFPREICVGCFISEKSVTPEKGATTERLLLPTAYQTSIIKSALILPSGGRIKAHSGKIICILACHRNFVLPKYNYSDSVYFCSTAEYCSLNLDHDNVLIHIE